MPVLAVLGGENRSHEPRLDRDYPGYNFNISNQPRSGVLQRLRPDGAERHPAAVRLRLPAERPYRQREAPNKLEWATAPQQVADGDVALGMVVQHVMQSKAYYDPVSGEGSAIFITYDDAQSTLDHIHPHRPPMAVVSPYAGPGSLARATTAVPRLSRLRNCSSGCRRTTWRTLRHRPPGPVPAVLQRDYRRPAVIQSRLPGRLIGGGSPRLGAGESDGYSAPDRDDYRLGVLARLSMRADTLHTAAAKMRRLGSDNYRGDQTSLYRMALEIADTPPAP